MLSCCTFQLLAHRALWSAAVVVARRGKNASARSFSVRRARDFKLSQLSYSGRRGGPSVGWFVSIKATTSSASSGLWKWPALTPSSATG
jgi:hypothetical protein